MKSNERVTFCQFLKKVQNVFSLAHSRAGGGGKLVISLFIKSFLYV